MGGYIVLFFKYMGLGILTVGMLVSITAIVAGAIEDSTYLDYKDSYILASKWVGIILFFSAIIGLFYRIIGV